MSERGGGVIYESLSSAQVNGKNNTWQSFRLRFVFSSPRTHAWILNVE